MSYNVDLKDQSFGFLRVEEKMPYKENRYNVWRCHCENCGADIMVNTQNLRRGTITNCGCIPQEKPPRKARAEDLTGQVFGLLTVLYRAENHRNGRVRWACQCECGNQIIVTAHELKAGKTKSCGCYRRNNPSYVNLTNQVFGRLTALYPTKERDYKGSVIWHCACSCGNELSVSADSLVHGNYRSCGCLKKEIEQNINHTLRRIEDTCVQHLENRKHRRDNTSGFRGLYRLKNGHYRVAIGFKKQRYYLGTFESFEEAVQARIKAEEILHDGFVKAYHLWEKKAEDDPLWAQENPFYYRVERAGSRFLIQSTSIPDSITSAIHGEASLF